MNRYLIHRNIPGAGRLTRDELAAIAARSNGVLDEMAPRARWEHSYVTDDAIVCVYLAEDEAAVREHGERGGFPVDEVTVIGTVIDPMTATA